MRRSEGAPAVVRTNYSPVMTYLSFNKVPRTELRIGQRVKVVHIGSIGKNTANRLPDLLGRIEEIVRESDLLHVLLEGENHIHHFRISSGANVGISRGFYPNITSIDVSS